LTYCSLCLDYWPDAHALDDPSPLTLTCQNNSIICPKAQVLLTPLSEQREHQ